MDKQDKIIQTLAVMQDKIVESIVDLQADMKQVKADVATTKVELRELKTTVDDFVHLHLKTEAEVAALHSRGDRHEARLTKTEEVLGLQAA